MTRDLFIYVDESGDFNFSPTSTSWYYITALSTVRPDYGVVRWHAIKHAAIRAAILHEELHAAEDNQWVRDLVFPLIGDGKNDLRIDAIAIDKAKANPAIRDKAVFYRSMSLLLLRYVVEGRRRSFDRLFIFVDTIPVKRLRNEIVGGLKRALAATLPGVPYHIAERDSRGEHLLQLVDYCCRALYVARERREPRPRAAIGDLIHSDFNVFRQGKTRYY